MGKRYNWWKPEEIELIKKQQQAGVAIENVAVPNRTTEYIRRKARQKGLVEKQRHPPLSVEQREELRKLRLQGCSVPQISEFDLLGLPHRTANAIQKILGKIGMVNKNRSLAAKNRKRWLNGEKQKFDDFLRNNSKRLAPKQLAPEQIAKRFGIVEATVTKRQRLLGVKTSLAETLAIPYVRKKAKKARREKARKMLLDFQRHIAKRKKQLEALAKKLRSQKRLVALEKRRCKKCGGVWLRHEKFFPHATYKNKTMPCVSWHFSRVCAICVAKERHQKKVAKYERRYSRRLA